LGKNDINPYGECEFLAATGEYFFERPQLLAQTHRELYALITQAFIRAQLKY
jgi:hypothetical protein